MDNLNRIICNGLIMFNLKDKVALITGGSRGIGSEICATLAAAGANVIVNYNSSPAAAETVVSNIKNSGGNATLKKFNVANITETEGAIKEIISENGRIDILVANAGISIDSLFLRLNSDDVSKMWDVNVMGSIIPAKAVMKQMMKQKHGRIIFMGSVVGDMGNVGQTGYSATKAALGGAAKSLAKEYGSRGITVNMINPGFIETDMTGEMSQEARDLVSSQIPVGYIGAPKDIAAGVLYLSSDEARYITGQTLRINGGLYME